MVHHFLGFRQNHRHSFPTKAYYFPLSLLFVKEGDIFFPENFFRGNEVLFGDVSWMMDEANDFPEKNQEKTMEKNKGQIY